MQENRNRYIAEGLDAVGGLGHASGDRGESLQYARPAAPHAFASRLVLRPEA